VHKGLKKVLKFASIPSLVVGYVIISGTTGFCPTCEIIVSSVGEAVGILPVAHPLEDGNAVREAGEEDDANDTQTSPEETQASVPRETPSH